MKRSAKRPPEGTLREDAGTVDKEGFIAPTIGVMEHALYFTTAPSVTDKAKQVLDEGRLVLPGAVIVWDETIGRRKGSKAVSKSWWAADGSVTVAFAFPARPKMSEQQKRSQIAAAVVSAIGAFQPRAEVTFRKPNDLYIGEKKLGAVFIETQQGVDLAIVRLNGSTDLSKAPTDITSNACRLIDFIDINQLPLKNPGTLPGTLVKHLMKELPHEFAKGSSQ